MAKKKKERVHEGDMRGKRVHQQPRRLTKIFGRSLSVAKLSGKKYVMLNLIVCD